MLAASIDWRVPLWLFGADMQEAFHQPTQWDHTEQAGDAGQLGDPVSFGWRVGELWEKQCAVY